MKTAEEARKETKAFIIKDLEEHITKLAREGYCVYQRSGTLDGETKKILEEAGYVITHYQYGDNEFDRISWYFVENQ
jgi:hypothetical protein